LIDVRHQPDGGAFVVLGPQLLLLAPQVVADQRVGHAEDSLRAAVVALEPHDPHAGVILLKLEDVIQIGAAPPINRLVGIASHCEIWMVGRQRPQDYVLRAVRVLILVDEHILVSLVEIGADFRVRIEELGDMQE